MLIWLPYLHFFSFLAYVYLAVYIVVKNPKVPLNRICAAVFFCFAVWCLGKTVTHNPHADETTAKLFMNITILGAWNFSSFLLWFFLILTEQKKILEKKWILPLLFTLPALAIVDQWLRRHPCLCEAILRLGSPVAANRPDHWSSALFFRFRFLLRIPDLSVRRQGC